MGMSQLASPKTIDIFRLQIRKRFLEEFLLHQATLDQLEGHEQQKEYGYQPLYHPNCQLYSLLLGICPTMLQSLAVDVADGLKYYKFLFSDR